MNRFFNNLKVLLNQKGFLIVMLLVSFLFNVSLERVKAAEKNNREEKIYDDEEYKILKPVSGLIEGNKKKSTNSKTIKSTKKSVKSAAKSGKENGKKKKVKKPVVYELEPMDWAFYLGRRLTFNLPIAFEYKDESEIKRIRGVIASLTLATKKVSLEEGIAKGNEMMFEIPWKVAFIKNNNLILRHSPGRYLYSSRTKSLSYDELLAMISHEMAHEALFHQVEPLFPLKRYVSETDWKPHTEKLWNSFLEKVEQGYDASREKAANLLSIRILQSAWSSGKLQTMKKPHEIVLEWLDKVEHESQPLLKTSPYSTRHPGAAWQKEQIERWLKSKKIYI